MKRIMKVFTVLLLAVCMTLSSLPVSAAEAAGNDLLQKGEVSVEEAILINLFQYADTLLQDQIKGEIEDAFGTKNPFPDTPSGKTVEAVYELFMSSAYAYSELGEALEGWRGQKKASLESVRNTYKQALSMLWGGIETVYQLGQSHRGSNTKLLNMNTYRGIDRDNVYVAQLARAGKSVEKAKSEAVFRCSPGARRQIQEWADTLYDTCNRMVPMQVIYNLGRFGTVSVPDDAAFVETDVSCTFISKSKAKSLNVYTSRAAAKLRNGDRVNVYASCDDDTQDFRIIDNGDGTYRIRVNAAKKYLDIYNTKTDRIAKNGAKVQVWSKSTDHWRDQCFTFSSENGYTRILLAANPDYCLCVRANGYLALGRVKTGDDSQLWKIMYDK